MLEKNKMGRVSADIILANNRDVVNLADADNVLEQVKHVVVSGVVDSGCRTSSCRNALWTNFGYRLTAR